MLNNFYFTVTTLLEDITELTMDYREAVRKYRSQPQPDNPSLFVARAKFIEQAILLGVSAEYLLKGVLLKNGYALNIEVARVKKKLNAELLQRIRNFNEKDPFNWSQHEEIYKEAEKKLPKVSGKTIKFEECKNLFMSDIVINPQAYFSGLANLQYMPSNPETVEFYDSIIDSSNVLSKIQYLRNNYVHIPNTMYEETGLIPFLYNYLIFITKKEFPKTVTSSLNYMS